MSESNILSDPQDKTQSNEPDFQDVLKAEYTKLHKEYRSLENKRHAIAQRDGYIHKRTDRLMPLLEQDHTELRHEMRNATSKTHRRIADHLATNMKEALKTFDMYQQEIAKKIKQITEIEHHVDRITDKVFKQRFKMLALHGLSKTMAQRERELAKAEDKLYHYTCTFNLQIHENKTLREEIMDFLIEREQFFKMHNRIKRQIAFAKKKMLSIVQQAIATYDNRDEAMSKVKALREREQKEGKQHGLEVQEFERTFHHDKTILDFIKIKLRSRPEFEDAADRRVRIGSAKERELDAILRRYRKSFKRILAYSDTQSILDLVDKYNKLDTDNFEGFKYITNLNNECEVLRERIEFLKSNIEDEHIEVEKRQLHQRNSQKKLQLEIITLQEQMEAMRKQKSSNKHKQKNTFDAIAAALVLADCNTAPLIRLLGNSGVIDENNVRLCFSLLDIKITELKFERDRLREIKSNSANVNTFKPALTKSKPPPSQGGPFFPKVMMFHGESVDDEDTKIFEQEPFYYEEMKQYVFQKMIEDKLVDPVMRQLSVSNPGLSKPQSISGTSTNANRKTLVERVQQSQLEIGGPKRRKKNHLKDVESTISTTTTIDDASEVSRKKTESIIKLGHQVQQTLLKDPRKEKSFGESVSSHGHPEQVEDTPDEEAEEMHQDEKEDEEVPSPSIMGIPESEVTTIPPTEEEYPAEE